MEKAIAADSFIGLSLVKTEDAENPAADDLFEIGTAAKIVRRINLPDGGVNIFISTVKRFHVMRVLQADAPISVVVQYMEDENFDTPEVKALTRALISEMKQVAENNPLFSEEMRLSMVNIDQPGKIADFITSILNIDRAEQQRILEMTNVQARMEHVLIFIKKEQELLKIQKKIQEQLGEKISKSQREYFLKEELKAIKTELGMAVDAKSSEYQRFREAVDKLAFQGEVKEQVEQELEKFSLMEPNSPEFTVTRNYLESIVALPWNTETAESIDVDKAMAILNEDHYGLDDVKERIVEYLAVRKLKKDSKGSIICLVGPPGVGKTSVGKSIARALGRQFFRFSVGGMRDEAEIKGHRRTYIGAMPGKIIQGLKIVKTKNPVYMIDEIDKLGASYQGDPSSALLEVLDPEQNVSFRDHYLDLPFDISHILFVTTANTLDSIPSPSAGPHGGHPSLGIYRCGEGGNREALPHPEIARQGGPRKGERQVRQRLPCRAGGRVCARGRPSQFRESAGPHPSKGGPRVAGKGDHAAAVPEKGVAGGVPREAGLPRRRDGGDIQARHGDGPGVDADGRRGSHHRGRGKRGQGRLQAHGQARRGHAGVREHRVLLRAPDLRPARRRGGLLGEAPHPSPCARRGNAQGRPVRRHHAGIGAPFAGNWKEAQEVTGDDGRAVPRRQGAAHRRAEGEGDRGAPQPHQAGHLPEGQPA